MKPTSIFCLILGGFFILTCSIWIASTWYGVIDAIQGITVLNSEDEVFVFIDHSKAVLAENRLRLLAKNTFGVLLFPENVSKDFMVVHLKNGKVEKYDLKGFGNGGSAFVYHGNVYWGRGQIGDGVEPKKWKWSDSLFKPLSEAEASLLDYQHIQNIDEVTRAEGWKQYSFNVGFSRPEMAVQMRENDVKIWIDHSTDKSNNCSLERIVLEQASKPNKPEILFEITQGYRPIVKKEYLQIIAQKRNSHE